MESRGLDGAGKTTIVKRIMGEDVNTSSPTLGFIIKTHEYRAKDEAGNENTYRLNICEESPLDQPLSVSNVAK